jgi:MFS family permease
VQMCLVSYLVSYLNLELGHSHLAAGSALLASQLTAVVVRLLLGWLLDRVGGHLTVLAILGLGSGTLALMLGAASPAWPYATVLAVAMVAGGFMLGWNAVYFAAVARFAPPGRSGTAVGGTQIFTAVGSTVGPLLFAAIVSATGRYSIAFLALAGFSLVMGIRLLAQRWR